MSRLTDMLSFLAGRQAKPTGLPRVWKAGRLSIFDFLQSQTATATADGEDLELPDEELFYRDRGKIRWAAGALDGVGGHHAQPTGKSEKTVLSALAAASQVPSSRNLKALYTLLLDQGTLNVIDPVLSSITSDPPHHLEGIYRIAMWLATQSPDREPVKFGIALLGIFERAPIDLLLALGRHEEFTLYAAVALANRLPRDTRDMTLWRLAKQVRGWGRIHCVERLATTTHPDIKAWLLREGYRNSIMYEYLAYTCATSGDLVGALRQKEADAELLKGAGDILGSLTGGGPCEDFTSYADGAEAARLYADHMAHLAVFELRDFLALSCLKSFVDDDDHDWAVLEPLGWSKDMRQSLSAGLARLLTRPERKPLIEAHLASAAMGDRLWALQALREWGREAFSPEMIASLDKALARETDDDLRDMIRDILADETRQ